MATFRERRFAFLWFGLGAAAGAFLTYGLFALDPESLEGLLAAQRYHAGRGGFDFAFTIGSVSRLTRGYIAVAAVVALTGFCSNSATHVKKSLFLPVVILLSCAAVMLLQLSAPFPYDDYQVPVMPPLVAVIAAFAAGRLGAKTAPLALALTLAASFSSPLLQEWATCGQDRFWSVKREKSALAQLRETARKIESLDPGGKTLLTQDLYLAVETGRKVPRGFEMGPFSYFPALDDETALRRNVLNKRVLSSILAKAAEPVAAGSGYAFAIEAPACGEVPFADQMEFWEILKERYALAFRENAFGQNNTPLVVLRKKEVPSDGNP